jgi:putative transposase
MTSLHAQNEKYFAQKRTLLYTRTMFIRVTAIGFIFAVTLVAWIILGATIQARTWERSPALREKVVSNWGGPDFKEFIRISGMTHVRTSPYYPQSNGKLERWHQSIKRECIRPGTPLTPDDARRLIASWVDHYNTVRLHSAIGFVTPSDMVAGRQAEIHAGRDRKLEAAREQRQLRRQQAA